MIPLTLEEIVQAAGGLVDGPIPAISARGVSTDSRTVQAGDVFFALHGPRFDGHDFVPAAIDKGAVAAVVQRRRAAELARRLASQSGTTLIRVDDPLTALGRLAAYHREQTSADVIAVAGSNGKTTTKAMIDHLLSERLRGRCSPRSFNNAIGVPLTLLAAEAADDYLVVEIGTNAPGEVRSLAALARPKLAVITCIGAEHLQRLDNLEGVAAEECSLLDELSAAGFAAINIDWPRIRDYLPRGNLTVVTFGRSPEADLRITATRYESPWLHFEINARFAYRLRAPGAHNALNAAAAIAIARRLGFEHEQIAARLESFALPAMRSQVIEAGGLTLVNDAYNANPDSAAAAIAALEEMPARGRRVLVFGEMCELGAASERFHRQIAERLLESRIDLVVLVGPAAEMMGPVLAGERLFGPRLHTCPDVPQAAALLAELLRPGDVAWFKASRAVGLERAVEDVRSARTPCDQAAAPAQRAAPGCPTPRTDD